MGPARPIPGSKNISFREATHPRSAKLCQQSSETAKEFYLEQMEKTDRWQAEHARHEEQKEVKHSDKQAEPAPVKLVPDGK